MHAVYSSVRIGTRLGAASSAARTGFLWRLRAFGSAPEASMPESGTALPAYAIAAGADELADRVSRLSEFGPYLGATVLIGAGQ